MTGKVTAKQRAQHVVADFYGCDLTQFLADPGQVLQDAIMAGGLSAHAQTASQSEVGCSFLINFATPGFLSVQVERDGYVAVDCYVRGGDPKNVVRCLKTVFDPKYHDVMLIGRGITNMEELHGQPTEVELDAQQSESDVPQSEARTEEVGEAGVGVSGSSGGVEGPSDRYLDPAQA